MKFLVILKLLIKLLREADFLGLLSSKLLALPRDELDKKFVFLLLILLNSMRFNARQINSFGEQVHVWHVYWVSEASVGVR